MADDDAPDGLPDKLEFHYQKSPSYRTIHVDGAVGGPTARNYLAITFYNERATVPRRTSRAIKTDGEEGTLGPEAVEESLGGVLRHLEVTALLDINAARELLTWLRRHVGVLEELIQVPAEDRIGDVPKSEVN